VDPDDQPAQAAEPIDHQSYVSTLEQVEAELSGVEHALRRLDDGTYGTCEACGGPIGPERLQSAPAARFCAAHERRSVEPSLW
jgi:DnaK suppressor protein